MPKILNTPKLTSLEILEDHDNKYRAVVGIFPSKTEMSKWTSDKFEEYYKFCNHFYNGESQKNIVNSFSIGSLNAFLKANPDHPWTEFWHRTAFRLKNGDWDGASGRARFMVFTRIVNSYVKANINVLNADTVDFLKGRKDFSWVLECFRDSTTRIGAKIVESQNLGVTDGRMDFSERVDSPEKKLLEVMGKIANVYEMVANSITKKQIETMNVKDKINALQKLSFVHTATRNFKPNALIFQKININKGGREELEKALLAFSDD